MEGRVPLLLFRHVILERAFKSYVERALFVVTLVIKVYLIVI